MRITDLPRVVALTTCHNRCEKTIASLTDLFGQNVQDYIITKVVLVDDGSTDGTSMLVRDLFPSVEIINGTGFLFWAGGMRFGWEKSVRYKEFDYLLVFNDDIRLKINALDIMIKDMSRVSTYSCGKNILVGAFTDKTGKIETYGGYVRDSWWHPFHYKRVAPVNIPLLVDTLNMNLALIPKLVLDECGFLAEYFVHAGADQEFGLRLNKLGGRVWLSSKHIGWCDKTYPIGTSADNSVSPAIKLKRLLSPKEEPLAQRFAFCRSHAGFFWIIYWMAPYIRLSIYFLFKSLFTRARD